MTRRPAGRWRRAPVVVPLVLLPLAAVLPSVALAAPAGGTTVATPCPSRPVPAGLLGAVPDRAPGGCTSSSSSPSAASSRHDATGLAAHAVVGAASYNGGSPPLLFGGGAVVGSGGTPGAHTVHAVFWAPAGYTFPAGYESGIDTYLADVAASDGTAGDVYSLTTGYTSGTAAGAPHLRYAVQVGTPVDDTDPYPTSGCTPDAAHHEGYAACLTDGQQQAEVAGVLSAHSLPKGLGDIYLLVFPPTVETCFSGTDATAGGTCSDTATAGYCAYHTAFGTYSSPTLFADIPYPTSFAYSCLLPESPHGDVALDSTLSMISHEHNETITDPLGDGWIDSAGNEDGDECAWTFGTPLGGGSGAQWNQVIGGHHYYLQQEFSDEDYAMDAAAGCAQTQAVPTASIAVDTAQPTAGSPVSVSGSGSAVANVANGITAWSWLFGDASGAVPGVAPSHTYASPGTYTVTLTVTDTDGFTATSTRSVVVASGVTQSAPAFTAASPPTTATVGTPYRATFAATGTPAPTFALSGAPAWLTVGTSSGVVSGTPPTGTTTFAYSLTAANGVAPAAGVGPFRVTVSTPPPPATHGYWLVGADGGIFTFGSAVFHGSTGALALQRPVVGIAPTADLAGYWLVASDGGIFAFGDAGFHGSIPGLGIGPAGSHGPGPTLGAPIVAMVPSTDDGGYFMVAADGGVFAFGDARFAGSCPAIGGCSGAAVAVVPDGTGGGYWLVTVTGGVYHFGDAVRLGPLAADASPVTSAVRTPDGRGFWVLFADGTLDPLGDAVSRGDPRGTLGTDVATAVVATADGGGYWVDTAAGAVHPYGDAPSDGSMAGARLNAPIIAASGW